MVQQFLTRIEKASIEKFKLKIIRFWNKILPVNGELQRGKHIIIYKLKKSVFRCQTAMKEKKMLCGCCQPWRT